VRRAIAVTGLTLGLAGATVGFLAHRRPAENRAYGLVVEEARADVDRAAADLDQRRYTLAQTRTLSASQDVTEADLKAAEYGAAMSKASLDPIQALRYE